MPASPQVPPSPNRIVAQQMDESAKSLEDAFSADVLTYFGPIVEPVDAMIRDAVEFRASRRRRRPRRSLAFVLTTPGGYIEPAERISNTLRKHYKNVSFVVPDRAMSAGTVLVMSGDEIWMDYYSTLGPIDPQVDRADGSKVPALGYLTQYERLIGKSSRGELTTAELSILIQNFDLGELYYYEQARELSIALLKEWLVKYKFKNWKKTKTRGLRVTQQMRRARAEEIGMKLNNPDLWHSHGRGISMNVLRSKLKLEIENLGRKPAVQQALQHYYTLLTSYMGTIGAKGALHTKSVFIPLEAG